MCRLVLQCERFFFFSLLLAAFKLSKTFLLEPYPALTKFCDININNSLIFLRNASDQRFSLISASPGLISHFVEIFSSVFNLLFLFELSEGCLEMRQYCFCEKHTRVMGRTIGL